MPSAKSTWHEKFNWKAEDYFDDPQVIALCRAIEKNDLAEIDRLVAAGADVNAQGKGKMTPLLWAFPDNKLARFKRLLEHGANPNVLVESDFGTRHAIWPGKAVTHLASATWFDGYCEAVFDHGGDPNLVSAPRITREEMPLFEVIKSRSANKKERIRLLIEKGADLDRANGDGITPAMQATSYFGQYDIALAPLEAGADPKVYMSGNNQKLIHLVVGDGENHIRTSSWSPRQKAAYDALVHWLERRGESDEEAKEDRRRWASWSTLNGEFKRKMDAEVAARQAREAEAKKAGR